MFIMAKDSLSAENKPYKQFTFSDSRLKRLEIPVDHTFQYEIVFRLRPVRFLLTETLHLALCFSPSKNFTHTQ